MNFPDRFRLTRTGFSEPVLDNYPCKFTVLDAFSTMSWSGTTNLVAGPQTHANLRVPLTLMDIPEDGNWLDDYRVVIQSPALPRMTENDDTTWEITGKRVISNHILYLLKL